MGTVLTLLKQDVGVSLELESVLGCFTRDMAGLGRDKLLEPCQGRLREWTRYDITHLLERPLARAIPDFDTCPFMWQNRLRYALLRRHLSSAKPLLFMFSTGLATTQARVT